MTNPTFHKKNLKIGRKIMYNILRAIFLRLGDIEFSFNKLGGRNNIVQVDETMLNLKCKSHKGKSPTNLTDAFCIIEFKEKTTPVFAKTIPKK